VNVAAFAEWGRIFGSGGDVGRGWWKEVYGTLPGEACGMSMSYGTKGSLFLTVYMGFPQQMRFHSFILHPLPSAVPY
jgi:hypothetical protein